ncbi:MAG TPA: hypothetical protein ENH29_02940 [Bacteroidetes bacterium]|nr:hypothetical protein [Bacteroidota bacterium]
MVTSGNGKYFSSLSSRLYKGIDFVPVRELADLLEARTYYNDLAKKIVVYLGNHKVKVTALNPFIMIDNAFFQMPISTDFDENGIWVPLNYFIDLISVYSPIPISYNTDTHTLSLVKEGVNILAVNVEEKVNGTLIRIATLRKFDLPNLAVRLSQGWMYVDIYGGRIDSTRLRSNRSVGIIRKLVPIQFEESAQLSFHLKKPVEKEDISISSSSNEILVSVRTSKKIPDNMIIDLEQERKKWLIDKIIIDPGHGGKDPGTIGYGRLKEKDVVLDVGKRLKKLLQKKLHVDVLMTRDSDRFVELRERSAFANRNGGKLFVSIHANAVKNNYSRSAKGVETYCLGLARTESDRAIAEKENSVIKYEDSWSETYANFSDENYILLAMAQNSFNQESHELAAAVQKELPRALNTKNRGVKQSNLIVLIGTSMPKILVEVGFISNPSEAKKLRTKKYRQKVAEKIFAGIKTFKESSERAVLGSLNGSR